MTLELDGGSKTGNLDSGRDSLTADERRMLQNMRDMAPGARDMLVRLSSEYVKTFPAEPRRTLRLVASSSD